MPGNECSTHRLRMSSCYWYTCTIPAQKWAMHLQAAKTHCVHSHFCQQDIWQMCAVPLRVLRRMHLPRKLVSCPICLRNEEKLLTYLQDSNACRPRCCASPTSVEVLHAALRKAARILRGGHNCPHGKAVAYGFS